MTTISACMIVKNEEELLPQCLDSIKGFVDEIVIVDTGSTDRTVEIAESYGVKVYHHPWQNDFSLHRNQSIGYSTGDWILIIDADEIIASDIDKDSFHEKLGMVHPSVTALVVKVREKKSISESPPWIGIRFFRKNSGVRYYGIVHNRIVFDGGCAASDIEIHHFGYSLSKEKMESKKARTEALLQQRLMADPKDYNALYYLCQMRMGEKKYHEAEEYGLRFFKNVDVEANKLEFYGIMYFYMAWAMLNQNDGNKAWDWAMKGLEFFPNNIDLHFVMATIGYMSKMDNVLLEHGDRYLELLPIVRLKMTQHAERFINKLDSDTWENKVIYSFTDSSEKTIKAYLSGQAVNA